MKSCKAVTEQWEQEQLSEKVKDFAGWERLPSNAKEATAT
jgi:hypothetical protein